MVWDGGFTNFGHLNGARWGARFALWIVFVWDVGSRSLHGVDYFGRRGVSWVCCGDFEPAEVDLMGIPHFMAWFWAEMPRLVVLKRLSMVCL